MPDIGRRECRQDLACSRKRNERLLVRNFAVRSVAPFQDFEGAAGSLPPGCQDHKLCITVAHIYQSLAAYCPSSIIIEMPLPRMRLKDNRMKYW